MTESAKNLGEVYNLPPPNPETFMPVSGSQQIFDMYRDAVNALPGFAFREFTEARSDFEPTYVEQKDVMDIDSMVNIIHTLITPESYNKLLEDFTSYWKENDMEDNLKTHSIVLISGHPFLSDIPIRSVALRDMRREDPYAGKRLNLVVGRMIPTAKVDLFQDGSYTPIMGMLSWLAQIIQTVPSLPEDATPEMHAQRQLWIRETKVVLGELLSTPGNIIEMAGSGTRDEKKGNRLIMHSVSPQIGELLHNPRTLLVPIFFYCDSFTGGLHPGEAKFKILKPRTLHQPDDMDRVMEEIAEAGTEVLSGDGLEVVYNPTLRKRAGKMLGRVANSIQSRS